MIDRCGDQCINIFIEVCLCFQIKEKKGEYILMQFEEM